MWCSFHPHTARSTARRCTPGAQHGTAGPLYRDSTEICCCMLLVAAELVVMAVTWAEMVHYRQSTDFRRVLTLSCVLYENGRAYFVSTMVMHMLHLVSPLLSLAVPASPARAPDMMSLSIILVEPIIAILVNRFLLALQAAAASASAPRPDDTLALSAADSGRVSVGLLQLVRADVDEWIQSEGAPPADSVESDEVTLDGEREEECGADMSMVMQRVGCAV
ncbi:uncharacterized protein TRAVEDRAFT_75250 [Trametes versicolor FP-101664 SS1]|uniref:uncharacterized protein n=1 Tax=Trametes versicolor (strain FP-101664) TaxID=717944 RepID=UPI0004622847|nr:uncharacterized protein TRAVEDRAFT_75250 [Trametes versicolor FP-101664 SS1]EIW53134.1 hypothetical protein TRAVEDRAFT_75250 [Trametes versicolor FP-101664 SS1]